MTIDDDKSIYVGGLPYECTESQLRRAFDLYGSILAVKIINDRGVGGRCYGFVTFKNPRSAVASIREMDGRTIGGRVVRVNEVKSRDAAGRSSFVGHSLRRNVKDVAWDKGRGRERDDGFDIDGQHDHFQEQDGVRGKRRDRGQSKDHFQGRDPGESRDLVDWKRDRGRAHGRILDDHNLKSTLDRELNSVADHEGRPNEYRDHHSKRKNSSSSCERQSRENSSESGDYKYQMEEQLDLLIKRREELQEEKSDMEQRLEEKKRLITDLEKRSQKLEDSLTLAKKQSSMRQMRLTKLHKCFQEVKECGRRLKDSEEKLQDLVNSASMEIDAGEDILAKDAYLTNRKL